MCLISSSPALLGCGVQTLDLPCILAIADVHAAETAVFWYEQKKAVFLLHIYPVISDLPLHLAWPNKGFHGVFLHNPTSSFASVTFAAHGISWL
jgi:hypothetical protein